jgi:hypothetical protein
MVIGNGVGRLGLEGRMPRWLIIGLLAASLVGGSFGVGGFGGAHAREAGAGSTPVAAEAGGTDPAPHPVVGTWRERRNAGAHITFFADGNVLMTDGNGQTYHGAWRVADGEQGIIATYVLQAWTTSGGQGIEGFVLSVDEATLDLGEARYDRVVAPDAASFADDGTPTASELGIDLAPTACRAEPRRRDEVEALLADATPIGDDRWADGPEELPQGQPVDAVTVEAISDAAREFAGCVNATDYPRWLALMTDDSIRAFARLDEVAEFYDTAGTPVVDDRGLLVVDRVRVEGTRRLPDGRVGAVVIWTFDFKDDERGDYEDWEANFHIFEQVDGRWLLDEEIAGNVTQ